MKLCTQGVGISLDAPKCTNATRTDGHASTHKPGNYISGKLGLIKMNLITVLGI